MDEARLLLIIRKKRFSFPEGVKKNRKKEMSVHNVLDECLEIKIALFNDMAD